MENTPVVVPVSKLKTHAMSAGLTFLSVFLPVFAFTFNSGIPHETALTGDLILSLVVVALRVAVKAALQALFLEEVTFWKKEVNEAKAEGQVTTVLPE